MNLSIFGINFHAYGLVLGLAIVFGMWVAENLIDKHYKSSMVNKNDLSGAFLWMVSFGVLGARLYHVLDYIDYYRNNFWEIFEIWNGGLGIYGAVFFGVVGLWFYVLQFEITKRKIKFNSILDVVSIALLGSQALGRLGNFLNQELYGRPSDLPWSLYINEENRISGYEKFERFEPLFLYEAVWNMVGFLWLSHLMKNNKIQLGKGNYFLVYLCWYGLGRAILEPRRLVYWELWGVPVASLVGVTIMVVSLIIIKLRKDNNEW